MEASLLLPLWRSGDAESRPHLLAEDATFSSPVTDYHGRAQGAHMLGLIARVLDIVEQGSGWHTDTETVSAFSTRVGRDQVQGMLREQHDETDRLTQLTLFLRAYSTLGEATARVRDLLGGEPATPQRLMSVAGSAIPGGTVIVRSVWVPAAV